MVEDENLREALKANGIGRPSTRAAIIEVLFKRGYIRRERKSLRATQAGIDLISLIKEDLLKSAKLTGIWENRLRLIEHKQYDAATFIQQIKEMISNITVAVLSDNSNRRIEAQVEEPKSASQKSVQKSTRKPLSKSEKK
jgi:DNA topoisomerase-3